ncbi:MAG: GH3 auxin-responsive promoter family protein [Pseudomonadota bacterium]
MPWFGSLYSQHKGLRVGKQYWSLSWLPESRRALMAGDVNDDSKLLSWGKRLLSLMTQPVPQSVTLADSIDDSLFATLAYLLAEKELTLISVWSPTFAINLFNHLDDQAVREALVATLTNGQWPSDRQQSIGDLKAPTSRHAASVLRNWSDHTEVNYRALWPMLSVISSWDTVMSSHWANKLQDRFPQAHFQGKGLWMTEGVVTIPWDDAYILAYQSHFYEFECVETGHIFPSWQVILNQEVIPIISTGSGFLRYKPSDLVHVTGFVGRVPTFEFIGRIEGTDLVGDKLSPVTAQQVLNDVSEQYAGLMPLSLLAIDTQSEVNKPRYIA